MTNFFIRVCSRPKSDLRHGFSYAMGDRGNPDAREPGLSGYVVDLPGAGTSGTREEAIAEAVGRLHDRMGVTAPGLSGGWFLAVFAGRHAGVGCDGEECFAPIALVAVFQVKRIASLEDAIALVTSAIPK